ncbi:MAG: methyltransferase domain-containing protein [Candidatus Paceibacterota bacterium]
MDTIFSHKPHTEKNGIKKYTKTDFYWGIVPRSEMESFNALGQEKGFLQAHKEFSFKERFNYAENYRRADFHFLLPFKKDSVILDLGSGFGNVTIPMAKHYKHVVAADASLPLLEYSSLRAKSENINNIDYVQVDPLEECNLPFKPKSFDVIILNGVLEWVGPAKKDVSPTITQKRFLAYLATLLKDDGFLYIGIENRLFPGWLRRDPHSKLKYTSILPRFLANWYAKKHGHADGYKTYIYSSFGYKKMLRQAGFGFTKFLYPYTTYREPEYIYSNDTAVRRFIFAGYLKNIFTKKWSTFLKFLSFINADRIFLSSFMIIASKKRGVEKNTPYIYEIAKNFSPDVLKDDVYMKVPSKNDKARFLVFHQSDSKPHLEFEVERVG